MTNVPAGEGFGERRAVPVIGSDLGVRLMHMLQLVARSAFLVASISACFLGCSSGGGADGGAGTGGGGNSTPCGDRTQCGAECVELDSNAAHCGACDQACDASSFCVRGSCASECTKGLEPCGRDCVELATSADHCGACSTACGPTERCVAGKCVAPAPTKPPTGCTAVTTTSPFAYTAATNSGFFAGIYEAGIQPQLKDGFQTLSFKLHERDGAALGPGTYDLSKQPKDTDACQICVFVAYDGYGDHFQVDFAVSGTMTLESVNLDTGEAKGTLAGVTFRHLNEVSLHSWRTPADDGHCTFVERASFDTRAADGAACGAQGDCPNQQLQVCDPATGKCVAAQCTSDQPTCPDGGQCELQNPLFGLGACYRPCAPFTSGACPSGQDCVPNDYLGKSGVCKRQGSKPPAAYQSCTPGHATTGCGPGQICATDSIFWHADICYPQCNFFGATPGCKATERCWLPAHDEQEVSEAWLCGVGDCHFGGLCVKEWDAPGVEFGDPCPDDEYWPCEGSGQRLGVCLASGGKLVCRQHCALGGNECPAGQSCQQYVYKERAIPGVGVCR